MWATTISFFSTALFFLPFVALAEDEGCPSIGQPRKHVVCYYDGKRPVSSLNICLCTHLIYTSIGINDYGELHLSENVKSDITAIRKQNPRLRIVASLGGEAVKGSIFSSLITENESFSNLTSSINEFHKSDVIDGLEIDWEWPVRDGGKKDRMKLIRYARQIKIAVGEELLRTRNKREAPIDTDEDEDDIEEEIIEANEDEGERQPQEEDGETSKETVSSTTSEKIEFSSDISFPSLSSQFPSSEAKEALLKGEQHRKLERKLNVKRRLYSQRYKSSDKSLINSTSTSIASRSRFPASSLSSLSPSLTSRSNSRYRANRTKFTPKTKTKLNNSHRSQIKRTRHRTATKKVKRPRVRGRARNLNSSRSLKSRKEKDDKPKLMLEDLAALEDLQSLVENLLEKEEEDSEGDFLIFLRLSPIPKYLVKGYDFKMLNKFVDYYTLPSNNFTLEANNVTFHHSRLMGASDIENADSMIDMITSLGADEQKVILTGTALSNKFNLLDGKKNTPGSASTGVPSVITYQQVCQALKKNNWTVERDEDMTGPYAYDDKNQWLAFDDATSLKIKTKYALLRNLGGVGLYSIDADDVDNHCGNGAFSLIRSIHATLSHLDRRPRQLIVHSLEQDLIATAQNIVPVIAPGISVSPYRIVRIVDREGHITSIRENAETTLECTRQGYYRNPEDCSQFYRCVKFNQYENDYTIFEYACPAGLVFDDRWEVCVWPSQASPCDGSSEIRPVPRNEYVCPGEGYFVDPENCRWFFACLDHEGDGSLRHYEFRCPFGLAFDEVNLICNWPWLVPACGGTGGRVGKTLGAGRGGNRLNGFSRPPPRQGKAFGGSGGRGRPALGNSLNGIGGGSGLPIDSRPFQSPNPGRQPVRPRPNPTRRPFLSSPETPRSRPRPGPSRRPALNTGPTTPAFETSFPSSTFAPSTPRPRPTPSPTRRPFPSTFAPSPTQGPTPGPSRRPFQNTFAPATAGPSRRPFQNTFAPATAGPSRRPFQNTFAPAIAGPTRRPIQTSSPAANGFGPGVPFQSTFAPSTFSPSRRPNSGRQSNRFGDRTPTQEPRRPKQFGGFGFGDVVPGSEGCQNCESPTLFIRGKGVSNGKGIEVAQSGREGKSNGGFPSTTASPVTPGYQPFFSTTPDYGSGEGIAVHNAPNGGYNYPVPSNPLHLPGYGIDVSNDGEYGIRPGSGISSTSPVPTSTTTTAAPVPSTYAPTTPAPAPAYGAPSSTAGYDYPVPSNPLQYPTSPATTAYQPPYSPTTPAYQPAYSPTTPAYQYPSTTKAPVYPSSTAAPAYSPALSYPSSTAAPPAYQSPTEGYNYPVPENPLRLPEGNRNQGGFRAPAIDNSGFSPINSGEDDYYDYDSGVHDQGNRGFTQPDIDYSGFDAPSIAELPRRPKTHQQRPAINKRPTSGRGLTPGKVQFGFTPIPGQNPRRPKQQFGNQQFPQRPRQPFQSPEFREQPSRLPNNNSPSFFNSVVDTVTTTFASFVPAFTTARPTPTRRPAQPVPPRPTPSPTRRPPTQRPRPRPTPTARRPQSSGGRRPFNNQEVANVIPSGFSSATLSNGPNSIPQGNGRFPEANRNVFGRPSGNGINSVFGSGRPSGGGSASSNNSPNRPFTAFNRPPTQRPSRPAGGASLPASFGRPAATRPQSNSAPRPSGIRPPPPSRGSPFTSTTFGGNGQGNRFPNSGSNAPFTAFNRPQGNGAGNRPSSNSNGLGSLRNNRPLPSGGSSNRPSNNFNSVSSPGGNRGLTNRPSFGGNSRPVGGFNGGNSIDGSGQKGRDGRQFGGFGGASGGRGSGSFSNSRRPQSNRPIGSNRRPQGSRGPGGNRAVSGNNAGRGGRQFSRFEGKVPAHIRPANGVKVTSVTAPVKSRPAVINKFTGSEWNKFGPGGFRSFNDTMGPEVCKRPGLFRHPTECDKFYECYWDKWIEKYTLHVFPCPVVLGYDTDITACNWPFEGPHAQCASS